VSESVALVQLLFYLQIVICPLIALNALIAIMGATYTRVAKDHDMQQYKEWACIISDVIRKWNQAHILKSMRMYSI